MSPNTETGAFTFARTRVARVDEGASLAGTADHRHGAVPTNSGEHADPAGAVTMSGGSPRRSRLRQSRHWPDARSRPAQRAYPAEARAEAVFVKYRGLVVLAPFACDAITRSSLVRRVCYDKREHYLIISLNGTYYHYCEIAPSVVASLLRAESMGRYYNAAIKEHFYH